MSNRLTNFTIGIFLSASMAAALAGQVKADAITDWNLRSGEIIAEAKIGTPPAIRAMAVVQTAAYQAANAVTRRYASGQSAIAAANGASIDAAIAAAHRAALVKFLPAQQLLIDTAYAAALAGIAEGPAKAAGIAAGESAAAAVLASRADDTIAADTYRPHAVAGIYVPTAAPAAFGWTQRKPWLMSAPLQFRPAPPAALGSAIWARDYNEVQALGGAKSTARTAEQTEIARFWEYSLPAIYFGVLRSAAVQPGREVTRNARLFAAAAQAMDDAMISVFDAKYHYNFWRPVTAIRNGDLDGQATTDRDAAWTPMIDTPMHPEYPSAHSILASAVGTVLQADIGDAPMPTLTTSSPTAKGASRSWSNVDDMVREVSNARIYEGVHFRNSTEVGVEMGRRIGNLAAERHLGPAR